MVYNGNGEAFEYSKMEFLLICGSWVLVKPKGRGTGSHCHWASTTDWSYWRPSLGWSYNQLSKLGHVWK